MFSSMIFDRVQLVATKTAVVDPIACCVPVRSDQFDEDQAELIAGAFAALADPVRLRLLAHVAAERISVFHTAGLNFPSRIFDFQPIAEAACVAACAGTAHPGADWLHDRIQTVLPLAAGAWRTVTRDA